MILNSKELTGRSKVLYQRLQEQVIGQDEANKELARATQKYYSGLSDPKRPITCLYFMGKTGCGKTKAAEVLSNFFEDSKIIKINCGEFTQSHDISKLLGAPPGYLGHNETKAFLNKSDVEEGGPNVILFDEIEKANASLFNLILSILDKGEMRLGNNELIHFYDCFIILTSNIGVEELERRRNNIGFNEEVITQSNKGNILSKSLKKKFKPELLNRIDSFITFNDLTKEDFKKILEIELAEIQFRIMTNTKINKKIFFILEESTKDWLVEESYSVEYGARNLKRNINKYIEFPLACVIDSEHLYGGDIINIKPPFEKEPDALVFEKLKVNNTKTKNKLLSVHWN
jgi:ATP-dependent Clp protease ATP-binding subunit ClpC